MPLGRILYLAAVSCRSLRRHFNAHPHPTHGQSRYQDLHRFRRPALSQQDAGFSVHRCRRLWRRHDVVFSLRQAPAAQLAEVAPLAGQGTVCLRAQLQRSRRRDQHQALNWPLGVVPGHRCHTPQMRKRLRGFFVADAALHSAGQATNSSVSISVCVAAL